MATPIPENRAVFSLSEVVDATGGVLDGPEERVCGVVTSSRVVKPGSLFFALRGERFDGHRFAPQAAAAGAGALVVATDADVDAGGVSTVRVPDTTTALGDLAAHYRARWGKKVVAITGSAGKTSSKELIAAALEAGFEGVAKTRGNLNNLVGVPMTLFCLEDEDEIAVIEMGTNTHGEIARLGAIGQPDVAVITLISAAHTEGLGSLADVAREKKALLDALGPGGIAVLNADDPELREVALDGRQLIRFGRDDSADVRLVGQHIDADLTTHATYEVRGVGAVDVRLSLLGEAAAQNAGAALAVALACGVDVRGAAERVAEVAPTEGRLCPVVSGPFCIIDDSYNANPRSTELALHTARALAEARKVGMVAVLGDMLELGDESEAAHRAIGELAASLAPKGLVFVGPEMGPAAKTAKDRGAPTTHVADAAHAIAPARGYAEPGDIILVKGSRSMTTERVVAALGAEVAS